MVCVRGRRHSQSACGRKGTFISGIQTDGSRPRVYQTLTDCVVVYIATDGATASAPQSKVRSASYKIGACTPVWYFSVPVSLIANGLENITTLWMYSVRTYHPAQYSRQGQPRREGCARTPKEKASTMSYVCIVAPRWWGVVGWGLGAGMGSRG